VNKLLLSILIISALVGCASQETAEKSNEAQAREAQLREAQSREAQAREAQSKAAADELAARQMAETHPLAMKEFGTDADGVDPLKEQHKFLPADIRNKRSVYYDYDKYDIKDEYKPMVEAHAKYLLNHADYKIAVQGNTDERGSREYNVALGHRRAESVRKMMNVLGVPDKQIETVSFGSEKPRKTCGDESCWKVNRRSDIVYNKEPD